MMQIKGEDYFIKSARLGFSKWKKEYFPLAKELWGNIKVTKLIDSRGKLDDDQINEKLLLEIANESKYGVQYFPIFLLKDNTFIGCCGLRPYDYKNKIYEIGFHIIPDHWRQGYAKEAAIRMIKYAFEELEIPMLFAGHNPNNLGSRQLLSKLGFNYIRDEYFEPTGLKHPSYSLINNRNAS